MLILDEPTPAHLGPPTAEEAGARRARRGGRPLGAPDAHRPEGLDLVDEVVRLDRGRIACESSDVDDVA